MSFKNFIHHLITPHCDECAHERNEIIDVLKELLESERAEKKEILKLLIAPHVVREDNVNREVTTKPIASGNIPWRIRREMLEQADRDKRKALENSQRIEADAKRDKSVEELEKELGVEENAS